MATVCQPWETHVDRGPDWLYIRLHPGPGSPDHVADQLWSLAEQHFVYRLVVEMNDVEFLPSVLMGQLVMLQKRLLQHDGALRICGLSPECQQALRICRLDHTFPIFTDREQAVLGDSFFAHPR